MQSWQWQNSDSSRRVHRRAQAAPSRVHHLTAKNWNLTGRKPTTVCQQDCLAADRPDIAFACKACSRAVGRATRADLTRLKRIGRCLLHAPRAVWEFPMQTEEGIVTIDGLSDADAAGCTKTRRSTCGGCSHVGQHTLATWSSTQKVVSLSSAGIRVLQHGTLCE